MVLNKKENNMIFDTTKFNTPEVQATREQFRQKAEAQRMALKNAPPKLAKSKKERPSKK
jgi:hypothetical protein